MCMKNKEDVKTGFEKYLEEFDRKYNKCLHEREERTPFIVKLFQQYEEDIYTKEKIEEDIKVLQRDIREQLQEKCNEEQNELINQLQFCTYCEECELIQKAFVYGLGAAQSLKEETDSFNEN